MNLVTGATGFIGSWLARQLLEEGQEVATFSRSKSAMVAELLGPYGPRWTHLLGDFDRLSDILTAVKASKPGIIYHIGGLLSIPSEQNPQASFATNVGGTFNILEAARLFGVPKVVFASSNGAYGLDLEGVAVIDDRTLQRPASIYGVGKVFGELLGRYYHRKYGIDFRSLRLPYIVGPGTRTKGTAHGSTYYPLAIESGHFGRPFAIKVTPETLNPVLYFKDAARAFLDLSRAPAELIKTMNYNMAGTLPVPTAGDLRDALLRRFPGAEITFAPDPAALAFQKMHQGARWDDSAASREWGWKARYDLDGMIGDYVEELKAHPSWYGR